MHKRLGRLSRCRPTDIVFDSTGLKIYGDGEWKVRTYGKSKRRTWRKLHVAMDPATGEIIAAALSLNSEGDAQVAQRLSDKLPRTVKTAYGDGAYDSMGFRKAMSERGIVPVVPPSRAAVLGEASDFASELRNRAILQIQGLDGDDRARAIWKKLVGYHQCSLVEASMYRYKQIFPVTCAVAAGKTSGPRHT